MYISIWREREMHEKPANQEENPRTEARSVRRAQINTYNIRKKYEGTKGWGARGVLVVRVIPIQGLNDGVE